MKTKQVTVIGHIIQGKEKWILIGKPLNFRFEDAHIFTVTKNMLLDTLIVDEKSYPVYQAPFKINIYGSFAVELDTTKNIYVEDKSE